MRNVLSVGCEPVRSVRTGEKVPLKTWLLSSLLMLPVPVLAEQFDTLILGGTVVDGSGQPGYVADVGLRDGKIAAIGDLSGDQAELKVDATGRHVVPGFIDLHGHADDQQGGWRGMRSPDPKRRAAPAHVSQGITTSIANSDGLAPLLPMAEQMAVVESHDGIGLNLAYMVSHSRVRFTAMGEDSGRPATDDEIAHMRELIATDIEAGAWGLATVLEMRDGMWSTTEELIGMTAALKPYDAVFIAHPRSQSLKPSWWLPSRNGGDKASDYPLAPSMYEASVELIEIAEANGIRVSNSHMSMRGPDPHEDGRRTVEAVEAARARGVKIFADMHIYVANPIGIFSPLIPMWALTTYTAPPTFFVRPTQPHRVFDFKTQLLKTLADDSKKADLQTDIAYLIDFWGGANEIYITDYPDISYIGRSLQELADMRGLSPVDMVITMGVEGFSHMAGGMLAFGNFRKVETIERFVKADWVAGDTDGYTTQPFDPGYLHPRFYGAYPEWIREYVIERETVSIEHAIRAFSGLAAEIVGLKDRGYIKQGMAADLSVINLETIRPRANFYNIHAYSDGLDYVWVNGTPVVAEGKVTFALPGRILRRPN